MADDDEFYVGYAEHAPRALARRTRATAVLLIGLAAALAVVFAVGQSPFDRGTFEYGVEREIDGVLVERPVPILLVPADGAWPGAHLLVDEGKFGAARRVAGLDGRAVRVRGSRIFNDTASMIEIHDLAPLDGRVAERLESRLRDGEHRLGRMTLAGEIVDSKCHLGVMKPGRGKVHKACAIRCISGGVPPVLRVEDPSGGVAYLVLVGPDGAPINDAILDRIAEPVEIVGEVARVDGSLVLFADPASIIRLRDRD